jgi:uncharacterized membrane protein YbaN (DUF454 family)
MNLFKLILIILGTLSLCIGIVGVVVPGLPTTPFILLTAGLYIRSSERLYQKMINNRFIGIYIKEFRKNKGMTIKAKLTAIGVMWLMIAASCLLLLNSSSTKIIVLTLGVIGTLVMGFILPSIKPTSYDKE